MAAYRQIKGSQFIVEETEKVISTQLLNGKVDRVDGTDKYLRIEKTNDGLMYKIFIPMSEMYPFQYSKTTNHLRFSLLVNDNNGVGRSYYEWSSGIGGTKDPKLFGAIKFNNQ